MEINEFAKLNHERSMRNATARFDWEYFLIALGGEAGELLNALKKIKRGDFPMDREQLAEEAADVITYGFLLLSALGVNAEKTLMAKYEKVNSRLAKGGWHER